jgi:hypothetical protein
MRLGLSSARFSQAAAVLLFTSLLTGALLWYAAPPAHSAGTLFFGSWLLCALGPLAPLLFFFRGAVRISGLGFVALAILFVFWVRSPSWNLRRHCLASLAWSGVGACIGYVLLWSAQ